MKDYEHIHIRRRLAAPSEARLPLLRTYTLYWEVSDLEFENELCYSCFSCYDETTHVYVDALFEVFDIHGGSGALLRP